MLLIREMSVQRGNEGQGFFVSLPQLYLQPGEAAAITGPSGCGKSTLLELIGLILKPDILGCYKLGYDNYDVAEQLINNQQNVLAGIRSTYLGFVLQSGGLLPFLTVELNLQLPRKMLGLSNSSDWIEYAINRLGLKHLLHKFPRQLSIGERQRVAFVRAIAHHPQLLLADEPTAALDPYNARELFRLMVDMVRELKIMALVVSHDWQLIDEFAMQRFHGQVHGGKGSVFYKL